MEWWSEELARLGDTPVTMLRLVLAACWLLALVAVAGVLARLIRGRVSLLEERERGYGARLAQAVVLVFGFFGVLEYLGLNVSRPLYGTGLSALTLATFLAFVAAVLFGSQVVRGLAERRILVHAGLDPGAAFAVARIVYYVLITLGIMAALQMVGLQLSSLMVALGALGIGLGFGLQDIVSNFVSGLILLFERPVQVGDWIEVEDTRGKITHIGGRSITVLTNDNISILIPNSVCLSKQMINWSHGDPRVRLRIPVGVAYGSDLDQVVRVLLEVADGIPGILRDPRPSVLFDAFGESSLDLQLAVWIDVREVAILRVRSEVNFAVYKAFAREGIQIPFPQRDVHLRQG